MITISPIEINQAKEFNQLLATIESQSYFMLNDPGERSTTDEDQKLFLEKLTKNKLSQIFVALRDHQLIGFIIIIGENLKKKIHSRYLAMGVLQEFKSKGVGAQLMKTALDYCDQNNVTRLELTVVASNEHAIHLYKKFDFEIEGRKKKSLTVLNEVVDEFYMARIK